MTDEGLAWLQVREVIIMNDGHSRCSLRGKGGRQYQALRVPVNTTFESRRMAASAYSASSASTVQDMRITVPTSAANRRGLRDRWQNSTRSRQEHTLELVLGSAAHRQSSLCI